MIVNKLNILVGFTSLSKFTCFLEESGFELYFDIGTNEEQFCNDGAD